VARVGQLIGQRTVVGDENEPFARHVEPADVEHPPDAGRQQVDHTGSAVAEMAKRFEATWAPLQPNEETRRMNPRVVAAGENGHVVVNYIWRGLDAEGRRFETEVLADYQVREGRLAHAQMFYYDLPGVIAFLDSAGTTSAGKRAHSSPVRG